MIDYHIYNIIMYYGVNYVEEIWYEHLQVIADYVKGKKLFAYPIRKLLDGFVYLFKRYMQWQLNIK